MHSYCTFCFRWAQFIGDNDLKIATKEAGQLKKYIQAHPEITDVLITGGDPLVMKTKNLRAHIEPLLELEQIRTIRIGSKALTFWPQRVVSDDEPRIFWICSGKCRPAATPGADGLLQPLAELKPTSPGKRRRVRPPAP